MNIALQATPAVTMTSREIAELTGKEHKHVLADIRGMLEELGIDGPEFRRIYFDSMNRQQTEFALDRELTDTLLAGYSTKMRNIIIKRWHELEAATKTTQKLPQTYIEALEDLVASKKAEQAAVQQLAIAAPKVEFVDRYVDATGLKGFRQVAKLLEIKEPEFRAFLSIHNIMYMLGGEWHAFQNHIDAGRFSEKTGVAEGSGHAYNTCKFTPKGVAWIAGLMASKRASNALDVSL